MDSALVLDHAKLKILWSNIAEGFYQTPEQIALGIVVICLIIFIPFIIFYTYQKGEKQRRVLEAKLAFDNLVEKKKLTPDEEFQIEDLSSFLADGEVILPKLLLDRHIFNLAVKNMVTAEKTPASHVAAIRMKLGFIQTDPRGLFHSSAELVADEIVKIVYSDNKTVMGVVEEIRQNIFCVSTRDGRPRRGSARVVVARPSGLFAISTLCTLWKGDLIFFNHSEAVTKIQNRNYLRRKIRRTVLIENPGIEPNAMSRRARLADLSAGGAKIMVVGNPTSQGEEMRIAIPLGQNEHIRVKGVVTRTIEDEAAVCIRFSDIRESDRDKIMKIVYR